MCGSCAPARAEWLKAVAAAARKNASSGAFQAAVNRNGLIATFAALPYRFDGRTDAVSFAAAVARGWAACQDAAAGVLAAADPSRVWLLVEASKSLVHVRASVGRTLVDPFAAWTPRAARRVDFAIRGDAVLRGETLLQAAHGVTPAVFLRGVVP